uniref:Uncharacterized protein n=1 Tax=Oryza glumipatula TaxID=40148 RepID=A0A0E0AD57_9ORYZ
MAIQKTEEQHSAFFHLQRQALTQKQFSSERQLPFVVVSGGHRRLSRNTLDYKSHMKKEAIIKVVADRIGEEEEEERLGLREEERK